MHTAHNGSALPGDVVRRPGDPASGDLAVDEAADGVAGSLAMFSEVYGRDSYDDAGATVVATVHYQRNYDNAFWNGEQLVFGDGDGKTFDRFTKPVDVLGHELTHAVTEHTAGLVYEGQSGALNESISDVFGACLKQRLLGQDAVAGDWLIGAGLFLPGVQARALRDMAHPGTAYDDPVLGKDPQPAHMDDYVDTTDDHGGVHINSGIPNRAFQLAAVAIGGSAAEGAGRIWYAALTGGLPARSRLRRLRRGHRRGRRRPRRARSRRPGRRSASRRRPRPSGPGQPPPADGDGGPARVHVRRTGGFAGLVADGEVDLDADDRGPPSWPSSSTGSTCARSPAATPAGHVRLRLRPLRRPRHRPRAAPHRRPPPGRRPGAGAPATRIVRDLRRRVATCPRHERHGLPGDGQESARSSAASTCRVVHGKTGRSTSAWWISSSSSVQPSSTPSAPASHSRWIRSTTRLRVRGRTEPCTSSS